MRPSGKIPDDLGRGGTSQLHLPNIKSPVRYLVDLQTLALLSKIGNAILPRGNDAD